MAKTTKPEAKRRPERLKPWSDADLDRLSEVTEADVKAARQQFKRAAPKSIRRLLDPPKT